jgi:hypothetical protein
LFVFIFFYFRAGQQAPAMYTETLPGDQALAMIIPYLSESMAGMYYCSASYANTEALEIGVKIETYGEYQNSFLNYTGEFSMMNFQWKLFYFAL